MTTAKDKAGKPDDARSSVLYLNVEGMHCVNCAALIERKLKQLAQVSGVNVDYPAGRAIVRHSGELDFAELQRILGDEGYTVSIAAGT